MTTNTTVAHVSLDSILELPVLVQFLSFTFRRGLTNL